MLLHHLQGVLCFYSAEVTKLLMLRSQYKLIKMFTYVIVTADDKIQSMKRCGLSTVIITVHGSCWLGGGMYSLDWLMGVIPMLVFLVYGYDETP